MFILTISSGHPCKKGSKKEVSSKKKKSKRERGKYTYFFLFKGFSLARILRVWVQGNDCTSNKDPPGRQSH